MTDQRTMLSFRTGGQRFNYRVAGIAMRDDHVLVCREDDDDYVMLPGGRVEFGELSHQALARELLEELRHEGDVGRLLFTVENFFERGGEHFHELALYYEVGLPAHFPFMTGQACMETEDEGHTLTFNWVQAKPALLDEWNLLPSWLRKRLGDLPGATEHLAVDER